MKAEFHIGDKVVVRKSGFHFIVSRMLSDEGKMLYSDRSGTWYGQEDLDYLPANDEQRREAHMLRLEEIHHDVGVLLEEGRCIGITYWDEKNPSMYQLMIEDVDLLDRVYKLSLRVK